MATEADLQIQVADYLRLRYPNVIFHSDYGSGIKLTMRQAAMQKRMNGGQRAYPDMFIALPKIRSVSAEGLPHIYHGLFIELKREGTRILKKDGEYVADKHIREQAAMLQELELLGYRAVFAVGFDQAKQIIDSYMAI